MTLGKCLHLLKKIDNHLNYAYQSISTEGKFWPDYEAAAVALETAREHIAKLELLDIECGV